MPSAPSRNRAETAPGHAPPATPPRRPPGLPPWVRRIGAALWVTNPARRIVYANRRAALLLGRPSADLMGQACFDVIAGTDTAGRPWCSPGCPLFTTLDTRHEMEPLTLHVGPEATPVRLLIIPLTAPDTPTPWLVHCALPLAHLERAAHYLEHIAARSPAPPAEGTPARLTPREQCVLDLLSEDRDIDSIAAELGIRYVTVRNHVQHLLAKLGAHSVLEAVARNLLGRGPGR